MLTFLLIGGTAQSKCVFDCKPIITDLIEKAYHYSGDYRKQVLQVID